MPISSYQLKRPKTLKSTLPFYKIQLVRDPGIGYSITDPAGVVDYLIPYFKKLDREHFLVVMLDGRSRPVGVNVVSIGTLDETLVAPREVFKPAILLG